MLLSQTSDTVPRKFSRDYDSVFLLAPLTLLAAYITYASPPILNYVWIAVVTSGATAMIFVERVNRQYRHHFGTQWGIQDLLLATAAVDINIWVWLAVL